ncbi:unnamed protein product [Closterium sp. NIES-53]
MATPKVLRFDAEGKPLEFSLRTASEFLTAIKARYATPTIVSLGSLFLPFLFPDLASFERTSDLITHLHFLDSSYRAACTDAQLALLPPPMAITIYFIATSLPDRLASIRDALLLKHPSEPTVEVLESALKDVESNPRSVASASGVVPPPLFHGCTVPQLPTSTVSLATATTDVTVAAVTTSLRSRGRSGRRGGQGVGGGGGGGGGDVASGGGGSAGAEGAPRATAGDSPAAVGGGDARVRQAPTGLPAARVGAAAWYLTRRQQQQPLPSQQPQQQQRQQQCFAQLTNTVRLAYGVDGPAPDWLPLVQKYGPALWGMSASQLVDLFGTPHAMYAVVDSSASDSVDSSVVSLGASLAEVPVASVGTCVDTSPGATPEDASMSFNLDSGASHCFFRDRTTLTPLPTPVSVALGDPTLGPVTARYTTTLPCPAVPSNSLTGFHVPSFSRNLVGVRPLVSQHAGVWIEPSGETAVCVDGDTHAPLATFTAEPGSGLYILHTAPRGQQQQLLPPTLVTVPHQVPASHQVAASPQVVVSGQVPVSGPVVASCSCRSLAHPTVLWQHRMGHPSISRLRAMSSQHLVLGLPRVLPSLLPSLAPPCGLCVEGRLHATPHSSSLRPATGPFETLHLDVWGPASRPGPEQESFFLVVVDDYSRYTTVFPLAKKSNMTSTLIRWLLTTTDTRGRRVSCLHSDRGGEFRSGILTGFCREQGICQSWTLPESPQQNGVAECRIGLVMEIARTSMTHARAPHFLWPYAVQYAAHQLNLWPRVSQPKVSPTSLWTGSPGAASCFRVWGCLALVRDTSVDRISPRAVSCVFLGFRVSHATPPPSVASQVQPPSPQPSSQPTADPAGAGFRGEDPGGASSRVGAEPVTAGDSSLRGAGVSGAVPGGATTGGAPSAGELGTDPVTSGGAGSGGGATGSLESGPGATTAPDTTPPPHPYLTRHQARQQPHQQQQQQQPPPPPVSSLRTLGLPSPSPPSPPSPPVSGPPLPSPDPSPAIFPPPQPPFSPPLSHTWPSRRSPCARPSSPVPFTDLRTVQFHSSPPCLSPFVLPSPPESALGCDALEDRQFELEFLAATSPHLGAMLLAPEGDPDALDIPTPRTYAEAVSEPSASQWRAAMDSEMASYRSTGTYVDEVPPLGANVVDGMWIFRVKRPSGSPSVFKARYVARGFSQREGTDFFKTFAPTPKMTTSSADPSLFVRRGSTPFFVLFYVDDLVFATADRVALADVLQRFELQHSTVQCTPLAVDHRLTGPFPDEPFEPSGPYAELVGCLMYLMTCTRPDLAFPLSILARFVAPGRHHPVHLTAAVRVAKYLATTSGVGLVLGGRQDVVLTGHRDSSYADYAETHKSTQGNCFILGSGVVSWRSTRSSSVSTSTAEAEIYVEAMAAQELRWLTFLLTGLSERPSSAPTSFSDNKATILLCREPRLESRVKHINVRCFLMRELQRRRQARLDFVESEANTADIFTKALPPCDHQRCCVQFGLVDTGSRLA